MTDGRCRSRGRVRFIGTGLALLFPLFAHASFFETYMVDEEDGMFDVSRYLSTLRSGFLPVPTIITEPAVGTGLAVAGVFFHESEAQKKQDASTRPLLPENISIVGLGATENGTRGLGLGHLGFWKQDSIRYRGFLLYGDLNLDFYSLAQRNLERPVKLNLKGPVVLQDLKFRVGDSHWLVGARQLYRVVKTNLESEIALPNPALEERVNDFLDQTLGDRQTTSGLGLLLEYDSRDNPLYPESGVQYSANYLVFDDAIGSDADYASYQLEGLNYWQLSDRFNLGFRVQYDGIQASDSERLPTYVEPFIDLRGIAKNRYQGRAVLVGELELTWKMTPRWSVNGFTGGGRAASSFGDLHDDAESGNSVGGGFRYLIARRYGLRMGLDVARGPEDTAVYIQAGASW
ncbi:BamA/TamA family outer membrane protein [Marinobacter sp. JSM 1782161]|uniref:BamA/TamA family outer membrane protein n=1 Tax=Marinobacter sp. JSM 1782161 TaxID=2685906 RepID=UPI001403A1C7|nr:BamA/TamA family outer membrane protein [Marinobacter sp. JSM 1782161]